MEQTREAIQTAHPPRVITRRSIECGVCGGSGLIYVGGDDQLYQAEMCWFCDGLATITLEIANNEVPHA